MSGCFPEPKSSGEPKSRMKVELYMSNYTTKADLKYATGVDPTDFAKKTDLANLKSDLEKSHIE